MNRLLVMSAFLFAWVAGLSQQKKLPSVLKIPMTADRWEFKPEKLQFLEYKSVPAIRIVARNAPAIVKDLNFSNGTIEYDVEPEDRAFAGIYFRRKDSMDCEYFYLRVGNAGNPNAIYGIQYAPIVKGVLLCDMLPYYQGPADFKKGEWNHIKLVVSGSEMLVYVNDLS